MGQSGSVSELNVKLARAGAEIVKRKKKSVSAAALSAKDIYEDAAARKGLVARRSKLAGRTWRGFGFNVRGIQNPSAIVRSRGPAWLHDSPTKAHTITARKSPSGLGNRRRRKGAKALEFGGRQFADNVRHPGTSGAGWSKQAKRLIKQRTPEAYQREMSRAWRDTFK